MKHLVLIILAATLSVNVACSKKKSSSTVATPPPVVVDPGPGGGGGGYIPNWPNPSNAAFYHGTVTVQKYDVYQDFLYSALGYQAYNQGGNQYGQQQGYNYNYNYNCDLNIFRWIFGGNIVNCGSYQNQYDQVVYNLSYKPALVQLLFLADGSVKGLWLANGFYSNGAMYTYGQPNGYQIPFRGTMQRLNDGRYMIVAGPLVFLTTNTTSNFDIFFNEWKIGNVTVQ